MLFVLAGHHLDPDRRELRRDGESIAVEPQVLDLLIYLVRNRDHVVSKDDLIAAVWGGRIVSDSTLTSRIYAARKAIGDSGHDQKQIRTVARKGHRFVGAVCVEAAGGAAAKPVGVPSPEPIDTAAARPKLPLPDRPAIAVLPFNNMSGDPAQEYFSDGISEDIITALSKLHWFFVIARNSTFTYKGKAVNIRQVGEELGVGYIIEGSVRRDGDRVRITAQLNDVGTGSHLWAERYDRSIADVFAVQDEITEAIVSAIEPQLYAAENFRARRKLPENLDAWELVIRALGHYWQVTRQDNEVAQSLLQKAIAIDPHYGQALGVLATSQVFAGHMGWTDMAATLPVARQAALAAVEADAGDPWTHLALAYAHLYSREFEDSLAEFELALDLNPNFSLAQALYSLALTYCGRWEEAAAAASRALRLNPHGPFTAMCYGSAAGAQFVGRNYAEAIRFARMAVRLRGKFAGAHRALAAAAGMAGEADLAAAVLAELRRLQPGVSVAAIATRTPFEHDADGQHYLEGLRRAGLE